MDGSVAEGWASYEKDVVPADAHDVQRQECRRAFYAGAKEMLMLISTVVSLGLDEDVEVQRVEALSQELEAFKRDVAEGRA